jgi:hypothetical protein
MYQFEGNEDAMKDFLNNPATMLNRETKKKKALEVISPPSAGKNWFFDPVLIFMGSTGQIQNSNKNTNFSLGNCFNKRVVLQRTKF